jgi:hypothetical protein
MQNFGNTITPQREEDIFFIMARSTLFGRLMDELRGLADEFAGGLAAYLRIAFLPPSIKDWLPVSLARKLTAALVRAIKHPIAVLRDSFSRRKTLAAGFVYEPAAHSLEFIADAVRPGAAKPARRSAFRAVLAVSGVLHASLLLYLGIMALFGEYLGFKVVNKPYRKLDKSRILKPLYYTPVNVKLENVDEPSTIEEAIEAERLRRERERIAREKAEEERKRREAEEAARAAAEEAKKKEEEPVPTQFGEFNEAPIKDILKNVVAIYREGKFDIPEMKFKVRLEFKIAKDGSIPKSTIKLVKSSGSRIIDENSIDILWQLGESHALMPLSNMSSNSIDLEVTDDLVRLTIVGFAPNVEDAKNKVFQLNTFKSLAQLKQRGTDTAEILSMLKITNMNTRVDADLTITRAKATEMINARFPGGGPPQ